MNKYKSTIYLYCNDLKSRETMNLGCCEKCHSVPIDLFRRTITTNTFSIQGYFCCFRVWPTSLTELKEIARRNT